MVKPIPLEKIGFRVKGHRRPSIVLQQPPKESININAPRKKR